MAHEDVLTTGAVGQIKFQLHVSRNPSSFQPSISAAEKGQAQNLETLSFTLSSLHRLKRFCSMSGFEVAGIVLGSIPIVVSALQCYMNGLGTLQNFRSYKRILRSLILTLKTEHVNLQNICEKLLTGIAPQTRIEEMIRDPFGDLWREEEIFNKLRLRLWVSVQVFDDRVQDMREAIQQMMEKLNVGADGKVEWAESSSIRKQFKRATFILQKSNHEEALTRIRDGVSALERLAVLNTDLETQRKSRSQGRLNKLVNGMLSGIYHALRSTMTCKCSDLHDVGLRLTPPSRTVVPEDDDEDIIKELQFRLAVSYLTGSQVNTSKQWNEILLRSGDDSKMSTVSFTAQRTCASRKTVGFAVPSTTPSTNSQQSQTVVIESALSNLTLNTLRTMSEPLCSKHINNLCETMQTMGKKKQGERCGHIQHCSMTETKRYDVYTLECLGSCEEWSLVPLKQVLQDPALLYGDKLRLAWMIACGVLQMQGTPWVADIPRSEDIFIAQKGGVHQFQHVFVLRHFPEDPRVNASVSPNNPFMLYLGILLIELILGQSIATLDSPQTQTLEPGLPRHILDYEAANKLLGRVMMTGGSGYYNAVERCLRSDMQIAKSKYENRICRALARKWSRPPYRNMPCFVYINGYPGIGKLTIAKELQQLLPSSKIYHNHLLIDPIDALVERSSPGYHEMRTGLRRHVLNEIATSEYTKDTTWIFTDARDASAAGEMGAKDYEAAARKRDVSLISIVLECEIEENIRRATNPARNQSISAKLTDETILRPILEKESIYRFGNETELVLDVTKLSSEEAALRIKEHVDRLAACP
ncbi:hypothetical protein FPRO05_10028 [Fusarium proliferatum]|uniref:DUF7580 domain-containing protein n=1 Tax=Gibberella intermedia TaxID=948311 RepID=A0A365NE54_GIBIN|nr:hypothetical protein FPRO05_10028 [Fusarium proliferatum]